MEYKIVRAITWKGFEKDVNNLIKDGWVPQGGATVVGGRCIQAMVREKAL